MPTTDFLPSRDGDLVPWTENFITIATANLTVLGLVTGDMTTLTTNKTNYSTGLNNAVAKQAESKAATDNKNIKRSTLSANIRDLARQIQAHPGVSDSLKVQLGLKPSDPTPTPSIPQIPTELTLTTISGALISLKWNRNGNSQGTIFVVEASGVPDHAFMIIDSTTKTTLETPYRNPTGSTFFRVRAKKNDQTSDPSNVIVI
ncbi:MAG: hypothetical protein NT007_12020 [Candidatus Kapabacteria bacterium]|nr:hypothetical protein [Candidatus Kapabacteria bacterium]